MNDNYEVALLIARIFFISIGIGSICCGWIVLFLAPFLFVLSALAILNGIMMLICAARGRKYMPHEKFQKEFR